MTKNLVIAALVAVIAVGGALGAFAGPPSQTVETEAIVEVTVWQRVSDGALYLSTRPEGGSWDTHQEPLDMSALSRSGNFRQGLPVTVVVPVTVTVEIADDHGDSFDTATPHETAFTAFSEQNAFAFGELEWAGDVDVIVFEAEKGTIYHFFVNERYDDPFLIKEVYGLYLNTYDAEGDHLDCADDRSGGTDAPNIFWTATYSGPLYLEIGGSTSTYSLVITDLGDADTAEDDHGDSFACATPVVLGDTPGELGDSDFDVDAFVLQVEEGKTYEVYVWAGPESDPSVSIYTTETAGTHYYGNFHGYDDNSGDGLSARFVWDATYTGQLYIVVGGSSEGTYTLSITDGFASATAVELGDTPGRLEDYNDVDFFVFEAAQGTTYQFHARAAGDSYVTIYNADREYLDNDGDGHSACLAWEATYSGPLYIRVGSRRVPADTYTLSITELVVEGGPYEVTDDGTYEGIGAPIFRDGPHFLFGTPYPGSPAERAGIRDGDFILEIDGESPSCWTLNYIVQLLRGPRGTEVGVAVIRDDPMDPKILEFTITREQITPPTDEGN